MGKSMFATAAASVVSAISQGKKRPILAVVAADVKSRLAFVDRNAEWQRVNSYIADALKDMHVLYAKLARLQGDFTGSELERVEQLSEQVLALGEEMSHFSREFTQGKLNMVESPAFQTGRGQSGKQPPPAAPAPAPGAEAAPPAPVPAAPPAPAEMPVEMEEEAPPPKIEEEEEEKGKKAE